MWGLTAIAWRELIRRMGALVFLISAAVFWLGYGYAAWALLAAGLGVALYLALPRPRPPEGALFAERMPSVYMPDLAGLVLALPFLSAPFIIAARETWIGGPWGLMVFIAPPGLVALAIFWIATRYQCSWIVLRPDGVELSGPRGRAWLDFSQIGRVRAEARALPGWISAALGLFGGPRGAGMALLHGRRTRHSAVVELRAGGTMSLPLDAFPDMQRVLKAMRDAGVTVDAALLPRPRTRGRQTKEQAG